MTKDDAKLAHALVSKYADLFKKKYGRVPTINRHREKWAMNDVIDSIGYDRAKVLLDYYFSLNRPGHPIQWFVYNFDKLDEILVKLEKDSARRQKLLEQTKKMVEENEQ